MLCLPRNLHIEVHKVVRLPPNLHFELHQVLCLPRNLHIEVLKVVRLPPKLRIEVHKVLRLPRDLHFKKQMQTLTMEGRFEHDPSMMRGHAATVVPQS